MRKWLTVMAKKAKSNLMWGGRFSSAPEEIMQLINCSIDFDKRLYVQDIFASKVHVRMLANEGIIDKNSGIKIELGLDRIFEEINNGDFNFSSKLEDIHMNVEGRLLEIIGPEAGLLHTARSRNDQVATDFRLWVRDATDEIMALLKELMKAFLKQAERNYDLVMPGFTHLQVAQPITFGHHMLAYVEMFSRDLDRFKNCRARLNECPLGAAALAGTSFKINRRVTAEELGFDRPMNNSLDAVSDRDFCLDFLSAASICATHLSRFSEEIVIWTSAQFKFVTLSDKFSTGSSIMPQKRNPDAAELIRGKVGRVNGALVAMLTVMKGLPLAYSKDLQEDKEAVFDTFDTIVLCINAMTGMIEDIRPNKEVLKFAACAGFSTATDLADWLVKELNIPFREAHGITGHIVLLAEEKNCELKDLDLDSLQSVESRINSSVYSILRVEESIASRDSFGGTAPQQVEFQVSNWKKRLF